MMFNFIPGLMLMCASANMGVCAFVGAIHPAMLIGAGCLFVAGLFTYIGAYEH